MKYCSIGRASVIGKREMFFARRVKISRSSKFSHSKVREVPGLNRSIRSEPEMGSESMILGPFAFCSRKFARNPDVSSSP